MRLVVSKTPLPQLNVSDFISHSIPGLKLHILNETLLFEGDPHYISAFDHSDQIIGEASIILNSTVFIGNVWIDPQYRNSILLFKLLKSLQNIVLKHNIKTYEAHVREYTKITPTSYTGRLGFPLLEEKEIFYDYFISPYPEKIKSNFLYKTISSNKRSQDIKIFYNDTTILTVEDYANVYQSFTQDNKLVSIGHVTEWDGVNLDILYYASQYYDYLNFKLSTHLPKKPYIKKVYKTSVFRNSYS